MHNNPEKVKESRKRVAALYRKPNPEKVKQSSKKADATYMHNNPEKVRTCRKRATASYRKSNPEKVMESFKNSRRIYNQNYPERVQNTQKRSYIKRKLACMKDENKSKRKRLNSNFQDNSNQTLHVTRCDTRLSSIPKAIELFHQNIGVGPEYICTCCQAVCRFNFPLPPMPRTMILEPLSETDLDENVAAILKKALERIRVLLDSIKADETMTFVEFLQKLCLSEQQYIKAIRLSLKHSTLFAI